MEGTVCYRYNQCGQNDDHRRCTWHDCLLHDSLSTVLMILFYVYYKILTRITLAQLKLLISTKENLVTPTLV